MLGGVTTMLAACNYTSVEDRKMVWKEQNRMHVQKSDTQRSSCSISIANYLLSLRWLATLSLRVNRTFHATTTKYFNCTSGLSIRNWCCSRLQKYDHLELSWRRESLLVEIMQRRGSKSSSTTNLKCWTLNERTNAVLNGFTRFYP